MAELKSGRGQAVDQIRHYAVYAMPAPGALADFGARWLGWDAAAGRAVIQPEIVGLDVPGITAAPRRYGGHGTIKPPFALAAIRSAGQLLGDLRTLCAELTPVTRPGPLILARLGRFLARVPEAPCPTLGALAAMLARLPAAPFRIDALSLMGEDAQDHFHQRARLKLRGSGRHNRPDPTP